MRHVLVIEDQMLFAQVVADVAMCAGASSVAIADSADEAVALSRAHRPFLIFSDIDLQAGGHGPDAVCRIRRELGPIPAIFVTGTARSVETLDGAAAILLKPVSPNELITTFNEVLAQAPDWSQERPHYPLN